MQRKLGVDVVYVKHASTQHSTQPLTMADEQRVNRSHFFSDREANDWDVTVAGQQLCFSAYVHTGRSSHAQTPTSLLYVIVIITR